MICTEEAPTNNWRFESSDSIESGRMLATDVLAIEHWPADRIAGVAVEWVLSPHKNS